MSRHGTREAAYTETAASRYARELDRLGDRLTVVERERDALAARLTAVEKIADDLARTPRPTSAGDMIGAGDWAASIDAARRLRAVVDPADTTRYETAMDEQPALTERERETLRDSIDGVYLNTTTSKFERAVERIVADRLDAARSVSWCRCPEVNGGEAIDWRTDKCRVCGLSVTPPGGGV